ncbi:MAG: amino acid ABC transporter substrate-binding protein [Alphaproteobacteria bacterium]|nr:amino acid ABC transporter substrate-binding protein [Alphaproteobacteria bacterium]
MKAATFLAALALGAVSLAAGAAVAADGPTLAAVKQRGHLMCGGDGTRPGISAPDAKGEWGGFDVDFCRVVAAAIFGDPTKVRFIALTTVQRFPSLQSGEIDVLSRSTTHNLTRDAALGFDFSPITMYAHTALMVHKDLGVKAGKELDGASVCVPPGTSIERNIADFWQQNNIKYKPVVIDNQKELNETYLAHRCDVIANFLPGLATIRAYQAAKPEDHVILPDVLLKEPLAITFRQGDAQWKDIVSWSVYATFEAEEKGLTSKNVDAALKSKDPEIQRLLGVTADLGEKLGLPKDFVYQIVKKVGNYEEIWEKNVGKDAPLKLDRGLNKLWRDGGVLYSPPFQ